MNRVAPWAEVAGRLNNWPFDEFVGVRSEDGWRGAGSHSWPTQQLHLRHFHVAEFDHPDLMNDVFLLQLDLFRHVLEVPLVVLDDARTHEEHRALYRREIATSTHWPQDSSHLPVEPDERDVSAVDLRLGRPNEDNEQAFLWLTLEFRRRGVWPHLGLGIYDRHFHLDNSSRLNDRRPAVWVGSSR